MSHSIHFISKSIPGCGPSDGRCLPCSEVSGRALSISPNSSHGDYKLMSNVKFLSLRCVSRYASSVRNASSSNYRRNSDFSRQNRHGFSRNRNRHIEEREGYEDLEESETFSSRNGPLYVSGNQKSQATASPGPREKEIVELFRKVQAQLRERAAMKEERKIEDSQGKSKESETVDSLLKLLRKHSVQQGKKNTMSANNRDFILDKHEDVIPSTEDRIASIPDSNSNVKIEIQESAQAHLSRPKSNFHRRSPVPEIKFQPAYSESSDISIPQENLESERKHIGLEPEDDDIQEIESDLDPLFTEGNAFDEILEDETSEIYKSEPEDIKKEQNLVEASNLSGMKLTELRDLAKSRGMKGYSKLKKNELIEWLSRSVC